MKKCNYYFYNINEYNDKTTFNLKVNNKIYNITSPLLGKFNVYNLVAAIITLNCFNIDMPSIIDNIKKLKQVPGRLQKIDFKQKEGKKKMKTIGKVEIPSEASMFFSINLLGDYS